MTYGSAWFKRNQMSSGNFRKRDLVANLAIWDILQALLTQTPLYIGYAVLQSPNNRGRNLSVWIFFLHYLFGLGPVPTMALLMADRFMFME